MLAVTFAQLLRVAKTQLPLIYVAFSHPQVVEPVIQRMLASEFERVREAGGRVAAFASLEVGLPQLLRDAANSTTAATRKGAAVICANRLPFAGDGPAAEEALRMFMTDNDEGVRNAAADVAGALRGRELAPYAGLLLELIASPAFTDARSQLLITLERSPGRVDELVLACARRFVDAHRSELHSIASAAAGDAEEVGALALRAYAQAEDRDGRARALDLVDELLLLDAYGVADLVGAAER